MIRILKDPEGKTVFTAHEETMQITSALDRLQDDELIGMKKKLKEMEGAISAYKVCKRSLTCAAASFVYMST